MSTSTTTEHETRSRRPVELRDYHDPVRVAAWRAPLERAARALPDDFAAAWTNEGRCDLETSWLFHVLAPLLLHAFCEQAPTLPLLLAAYPPNTEEAA